MYDLNVTRLQPQVEVEGRVVGNGSNSPAGGDMRAEQGGTAAVRAGAG